MKARVLWQSCVVVAVAAGGCLPSGIAFAQSAVDCSTVAQDMARLKCYDEQAALRKNQTSTPPATTSSPAPVAAPSTAASTPAAATPPTGASLPAAVTPSPRPSVPAAAASSAAASPPAAATRSTSASTTAASAPAAATIAAPAQASSPASDFGLNADVIRKRQAAADPDAPKEPDRIVARVKAVATKGRGEYRITLEDGQVWEETQHSSANMPPDVGETVTIKRGLLGSYFLSHSAGLALRVKRIN